MGRIVVSLIAGGAFFLWFAHAILLGVLPTALVEFEHLREFHPAPGSRVASARCTNFQGILFHTCTIEAFTPSGNRVEVSEAALFRAPSVPVRLLVADTTPPIYSSTVSLADMRTRIAMLGVAVPLAILGLILTPAMPFVLLWRIRRSGLTASEYVERNREMTRRRKGRYRRLPT